LAVKVLRANYRDQPEACRRFVDEARVGSQLQHPAIVPIYELGEFADGSPFLTMKLVEGKTLAALLEERNPRGRSSADAAEDLPHFLGIFEQVCQAMAYAHARGVIHRDLKPANIMVGAFGEVQVMDWGFAKQLPNAHSQNTDGGLQPESGAREISTLQSPVSNQHSPIRNPSGSHSGMMMGTPTFMPPEQARGEIRLIDQRADVFALGGILCAILTGKPPYMGAHADEICRMAAAADLGPAYARLDACGADQPLRDLAKVCLSAERSQRPADAGVVVARLTSYLASAQERLRQAQLESAAAAARAEESRAKAKAERRGRGPTPPPAPGRLHVPAAPRRRLGGGGNPRHARPPP